MLTNSGSCRRLQFFKGAVVVMNCKIYVVDLPLTLGRASHLRLRKQTLRPAQLGLITILAANLTHVRVEYLLYFIILTPVQTMKFDVIEECFFIGGEHHECNRWYHAHHPRPFRDPGLLLFRSNSGEDIR